MPDAEHKSAADLSAVRDFHLPRYAELPDLGLYLEQALRVINEALSPIISEPITKPMMNNYVKHGVVPAAQKKQYYRDSLCYALVMGALKPVFTVEQVGEFFCIQRETYPIQVAYDFFCTEYENALHAAFNFTGEALPSVETMRTDQTILVRAMVLAAANTLFVTKTLS